MVWWVEWDKIFVFITYVEKLDRFTKSTYMCCTRRDSKRHHQYSFGSWDDLTTYFYSVLDAESEKIIFRSKKMSKVENFAHFEKECVFLKKRHLSSISYFSTGRKYLLRLKSSFSWSAAQALSDDTKERRKKIFTESLNCLHLTKSLHSVIIILKSQVFKRTIWANLVK